MLPNKMMFYLSHAYNCTLYRIYNRASNISITLLFAIFSTMLQLCKVVMTSLLLLHLSIIVFKNKDSLIHSTMKVNSLDDLNKS